MRHHKTSLVVFLPTFGGGGTERSVLTLLKGLSRERYDITILTGRGDGPFRSLVPPWIRVEEITIARTFLGLLFALGTYFKRYRPDVCMSVFTINNLAAVVARHLARSSVRLVISERTTVSALFHGMKNPFKRAFALHVVLPLMRLLYPRADCVLCVSQGVADDLARFVGPMKNIVTVYNPVDGEAIRSQAEDPVPVSVVLPQDRPIIVASGRLIRAKNYPLLLRAFALVRKEMAAFLCILGEGEERDRLLSLARELHIAPDVSFAGFHRNPFPIVARADVFALSSVREGFPNVLVEAMALGVPVVTTDCPSGPGEIVDNAVSGVVVPSGDEKSFALALLALLRDPALQEHMGKSARERSDFFSVRRAVEAFSDALDRLVSR